MRESLKLGTSNVSVDAATATSGLIYPGRKTKDAVSHGIYLTAVGYINSVIAQTESLFDQPPPLVLTGGDASLVAKALNGSVYTWADMVYAGLELMFPVTEAEKQGNLTGVPKLALHLEANKMK